MYVINSIHDAIMLCLQQRIANTWLGFAAKLCAERHLDVPGPESQDPDQVPTEAGQALQEAGQLSQLGLTVLMGVSQQPRQVQPQGVQAPGGRSWQGAGALL